MADWSALPYLALAAIADRLPFLVDHVGFRSACSSWRSAAPRRLPLPWLVLHRRDHTLRRTTIFSFSNLSTPGPTLRPIPLPPAALGSYGCGASNGWLVLLDRTPAISLFNPVTGARICLPPFTFFSDNYGCCDCVSSEEEGEDDTEEAYHNSVSKDAGDDDGEDNREWRIASKIVLSADPAATHDFVALAIHSDGDSLEFYRSGEDGWISIEHPDLTGFNTDVLFYQGRFYVTSEYELFACSLGPSTGKAVKSTPIQDYSSLPSIDASYLVEAGGDLLLVTFSHFIDGREEGYLIEVFKLEIEADKLTLQKMQDVADFALFLSQYQSFSLPVSKFPGLKGNHIYLHEYYAPSNIRIRVIDLEDCKDPSSEFSPMVLAAHRWDWTTFSWFRPSLLQ